MEYVHAETTSQHVLRITKVANQVLLVVLKLIAIAASIYLAFLLWTTVTSFLSFLTVVQKILSAAQLLIEEFLELALEIFGVIVDLYNICKAIVPTLIDVITGIPSKVLDQISDLLL
jgi:phage-related protein